MSSCEDAFTLNRRFAREPGDDAHMETGATAPTFASDVLATSIFEAEDRPADPDAPADGAPPERPTRDHMSSSHSGAAMSPGGHTPSRRRTVTNCPR